MYCTSQDGRGIGTKVELQNLELLERTYASLDKFNIEMEQFLRGDLLVCTGKLNDVTM
jgi:hypothetical protein